MKLKTIKITFENPNVGIEFNLEIMAFAKDGAEGQKEARSGTNTPQVDNQPTPTDYLPLRRLKTHE